MSEMLKLVAKSKMQGTTTMIRNMPTNHSAGTNRVKLMSEIAGTIHSISENIFGLMFSLFGSCAVTNAQIQSTARRTSGNPNTANALLLNPFASLFILLSGKELVLLRDQLVK